MTRLPLWVRTLTLAGGIAVTGIGFAVTRDDGYSLSGVGSTSYTVSGQESSTGHQGSWKGAVSGSPVQRNSHGFQLGLGGVAPSQQASATPSATPTTEPTPSPSPTPCSVSTTPDAFDLIDDRKIDSRDLIEWLKRKREGMGPDFDCSGQTDSGDLLLFSVHWQREIE